MNSLAKSTTLNTFDLTAQILRSSFEVMNELGVGFLETVYKNSLAYSLKKNALKVEIEKPIEVFFQSQIVGFYKPDLIVNDSIIVELKCVTALLPEHQAQVINYLKATRISTGLLINFATRNLEYKRLYNPNF